MLLIFTELFIHVTISKFTLWTQKLNSNFLINLFTSKYSSPPCISLNNSTVIYNLLIYLVMSQFVYHPVRFSNWLSFGKTQKWNLSLHFLRTLYIFSCIHWNNSNINNLLICLFVSECPHHPVYFQLCFLKLGS